MNKQELIKTIGKRKYNNLMKYYRGCKLVFNLREASNKRVNVLLYIPNRILHESGYKCFTVFAFDSEEMKLYHLGDRFDHIFVDLSKGEDTLNFDQLGDIIRVWWNNTSIKIPECFIPCSSLGIYFDRGIII